MGSGHAKALHAHPAADLVALSDLNESLLAVSKLYTSCEEMMAKESLDVVCVATPNNSLSLMAFDTGCHVFCEKPMAMNTQEGQEMVAAAKKADRRLMIKFSFRFSPEPGLLKREVERGILGEVYFGRTVWLRRSGVPGWGGGWHRKKAVSGGGPLIPWRASD